jgi:CopG family transcriptional regulator/antitoxin EndoAI
MAETQRVTLSLANNLLEQVDVMIPMEFNSRSDCVTEAIKVFINEKKKSEMVEKLIQGYKEMSQINLDLAEMGLEMDVLDLAVYEANLKRCWML